MEVVWAEQFPVIKHSKHRLGSLFLARIALFATLCTQGFSQDVHDSQTGSDVVVAISDRMQQDLSSFFEHLRESSPGSAWRLLMDRELSVGLANSRDQAEDIIDLLETHAESEAAFLLFNAARDRLACDGDVESARRLAGLVTKYPHSALATAIILEAGHRTEYAPGVYHLIEVPTQTADMDAVQAIVSEVESRSGNNDGEEFEALARVGERLATDWKQLGVPEMELFSARLARYMMFSTGPLSMTGTLCHSVGDDSRPDLKYSSLSMEAVKSILYQSSYCSEFHPDFADRQKDEAFQHLADGIVHLAFDESGADSLTEYRTFLEKAGRLYLSREDYTALLEYISSSAAGISSEKDHSHALELTVFLSEAFVAQERFETAMPFLKRIAEEAPGTSMQQSASETMADLYVNVWNSPELAMEALEILIRDSNSGPVKNAARFRRAKIAYETRLYESATFDLESLLSEPDLKIDSAPVRTLLGLSYLASGEGELARGEFARVVNINDGEYREKCLYLMGYSLIAEQRYGEAEKPFRDLIGLYPNGSYTQRASEFLAKVQN